MVLFVRLPRWWRVETRAPLATHTRPFGPLLMPAKSLFFEIRTVGSSLAKRVFAAKSDRFLAEEGIPLEVRRVCHL